MEREKKKTPIVTSSTEKKIPSGKLIKPRDSTTHKQTHRIIERIEEIKKSEKKLTMGSLKPWLKISFLNLVSIH